MVLMLVAVLGAASLPGADPWRSYSNSRFGYSLCYPAVLKPQPEAGNGDGRAFEGRGARLLAFGAYNIDNETLDKWASDEVADYVGKQGRITYRARKANWIVLSGTDGGRYEFYARAEQRGDRFVTFQLRYPVDRASEFRPIAARLNRCLTVGEISY